MRWFRELTVLAVFGVLLSGAVGCSYHNDHGHDGPHGGYGHHDREDVYVHEDDHHHHD